MNKQPLFENAIEMLHKDITALDEAYPNLSYMIQNMNYAIKPYSEMTEAQKESTIEWQGEENIKPEEFHFINADTEATYLILSQALIEYYTDYDLSSGFVEDLEEGQSIYDLKDSNEYKTGLISMLKLSADEDELATDEVKKWITHTVHVQAYDDTSVERANPSYVSVVISDDFYNNFSDQMVFEYAKNTDLESAKVLFSDNARQLEKDEAFGETKAELFFDLSSKFDEEVELQNEKLEKFYNSTLSRIDYRYTARVHADVTLQELENVRFVFDFDVASTENWKKDLDFDLKREADARYDFFNSLAVRNERLFQEDFCERALNELGIEEFELNILLALNNIYRNDETEEFEIESHPSKAAMQFILEALPNATFVNEPSFMKEYREQRRLQSTQKWMMENLKFTEQYQEFVEVPLIFEDGVFKGQDETKESRNYYEGTSECWVEYQEKSSSTGLHFEEISALENFKLSLEDTQEVLQAVDLNIPQVEKMIEIQEQHVIHEQLSAEHETEVRQIEGWGRKMLGGGEGEIAPISDDLSEEMILKDPYGFYIPNYVNMEEISFVFVETTADHTEITDKMDLEHLRDEDIVSFDLAELIDLKKATANEKQLLGKWMLEPDQESNNEKQLFSLQQNNLVYSYSGFSKPKYLGTVEEFFSEDANFEASNLNLYNNPTLKTFQAENVKRWGLSKNDYLMDFTKENQVKEVGKHIINQELHKKNWMSGWEAIDYSEKGSKRVDFSIHDKNGNKNNIIKIGSINLLTNKVDIEAVNMDDVAEKLKNAVKQINPASIYGRDKQPQQPSVNLTPTKGR